jgi:Leucine-rich repeat (LRR) protein
LEAARRGFGFFYWLEKTAVLFLVEMNEESVGGKKKVFFCYLFPFFSSLCFPVSFVSYLIQELPATRIEVTFEMQRLPRLKFAGVRLLAGLPPQMLSLTHLVSLTLNRCELRKLEHLPASLTELDVSNNQIGFFFFFFASFFVCLFFCFLTTAFERGHPGFLSKSFAFLLSCVTCGKKEVPMSLMSVRLSNNPVSVFPPCIAALRYLQFATLFKCRIEALPDPLSFRNRLGIKWLDLSDNPIRVKSAKAFLYESFPNACVGKKNILFFVF